MKVDVLLGLQWGDEGHAVIVVAVAHQLVEEVGLEERDASLQAGG